MGHFFLESGLNELDGELIFHLGVFPRLLEFGVLETFFEMILEGVIFISHNIDDIIYDVIVKIATVWYASLGAW